MSEHTPGPWHALGYSKFWPEGWVVSHDPVGVAEQTRGIAMAWDSEADARLIAAAPDLLEALEALVREWHEYVPGDETRANAAAAIAAIAKARGGSLTSE